MCAFGVRRQTVIMIVGKKNSITDFGVGAVLEDVHRHRLCTTDLLRNNQYKSKLEQSNRIGRDWMDLKHGPCFGESTPLGLSEDSI